MMRVSYVLLEKSVPSGTWEDLPKHISKYQSKAKKKPKKVPGQIFLISRSAIAKPERESEDPAFDGWEKINELVSEEVARREKLPKAPGDEPMYVCLENICDSNEELDLLVEMLCKPPAEFTTEEHRTITILHIQSDDHPKKTTGPVVVRSREIVESLKQCKFEEHIDFLEVTGIRLDTSKKKPKLKPVKPKDLSTMIYETISAQQSVVDAYNAWKKQAAVYDIPQFTNESIADMKCKYDDMEGVSCAEIMRNIVQTVGSEDNDGFETQFSTVASILDKAVVSPLDPKEGSSIEISSLGFGNQIEQLASIPGIKATRDGSRIEFEVCTSTRQSQTFMFPPTSYSEWKGLGESVRSESARAIYNDNVDRFVSSEVQTEVKSGVCISRRSTVAEKSTSILTTNKTIMTMHENSDHFHCDFPDGLSFTIDMVHEDATNEKDVAALESVDAEQPKEADVAEKDADNLAAAVPESKHIATLNYRDFVCQFDLDQKTCTCFPSPRVEQISTPAPNGGSEYDYTKSVDYRKISAFKPRRKGECEVWYDSGDRVIFRADGSFEENDLKVGADGSVAIGEEAKEAIEFVQYTDNETSEIVGLREDMTVKISHAEKASTWHMRHGVKIHESHGTWELDIPSLPVVKSTETSVIVELSETTRIGLCGENLVLEYANERFVYTHPRLAILDCAGTKLELNLERQEASFLDVSEAENENDESETLQFRYRDGLEISSRHVEKYLDRDGFRKDMKMPPSVRLLYGISEEVPEPIESEHSEEEISKEPRFKIAEGVRGNLAAPMEEELLPYFENRKLSKFELESFCAHLIYSDESNLAFLWTLHDFIYDYNSSHNFFVPPLVSTHLSYKLKGSPLVQSYTPRILFLLGLSDLTIQFPTELKSDDIKLGEWAEIFVQYRPHLEIRHTLTQLKECIESIERKLKPEESEEFTMSYCATRTLDAEDTQISFVPEKQFETGRLISRTQSFASGMLVQESESESGEMALGNGPQDRLIKRTLSHLALIPVNTAPLPSKLRPALTTVTGTPRNKPIKYNTLKNGIYESAEFDLNLDYLLTEGATMTRNRTVSTIEISNYIVESFAEIHVVPKIFDFGELQVGKCYHLIGHIANMGGISNMGGKRARFQVRSPEILSGAANARVRYKTGALAPGNRVRLEVEIFADEVGKVEGTVEVRSELQIFKVPLRATFSKEPPKKLKSRVREFQKYMGTKITTTNKLSETEA